MLTLYGIPNCNTVKTARTWLEERQVAYSFHDYKKQGVPADLLAAWCKDLGWERLLNRRGTTWRQLAPEQQAAVVDQAAALQLMQEKPSVIKRPVVVGEAAGRPVLLVGFDEEEYRSIFEA